MCQLKCFGNLLADGLLIPKMLGKNVPRSSGDTFRLGCLSYSPMPGIQNHMNSNQVSVSDLCSHIVVMEVIFCDVFLPLSNPVVCLFLNGFS